MQHRADQSAATPRLQLAVLLLAALTAACQAQPKADDSLAAEAALRQRIEAEIGLAACSSMSECRTLPMGSKSCGGPVRWMAWSVSSSRGERLQRWAQDLAQRQHRREAMAGRVSTCSVVPDPGAVCEAGHCVLARGKPTH